MQGDIYYVGVVYLNDVPIDCHFPKIGFHVPGGDEFHFLFNQRAAAQEGENTERVPPFLYILSTYIDRWQSTKGYEKLAEEYVSDESEPDDGKQKKKDWWSTDIKVEFDQLKTENPDMISTRSCAACYFFEKRWQNNMSL